MNDSAGKPREKASDVVKLADAPAGEAGKSEAKPVTSSGARERSRRLPRRRPQPRDRAHRHA